MNPLIQFRTTPPLLMMLALLCFGFLPAAKALLPPPAPDGGYPGGNTAEGTDALHDVDTSMGINNTAVGLNALTRDTIGQYNVAVGSGALQNNTTGNYNMAIGTEALQQNNSNFNLAIGFRVLFMNTTGNHLTGIGAAALRNNTTAGFNTAIGADAMRENTIGENNTAIGADALVQNTIGGENTAMGEGALAANVSGFFNTAVGESALLANSTGDQNTAVGQIALSSNLDGSQNTAVGQFALGSNDHGANNTAVGFDALVENKQGTFNVAVGDTALFQNTSGQSNTAIGHGAGFNQNIGSGNVYLGDGVVGVAGETGHTYIRNINSTVVSGGGTDFVSVNLASGLLGHVSSSRRYKEEIKPMEKASEALYRLKPVTYRFKKEIDPGQTTEYGLVAEEVAQVNPNLAIRDGKGQIESVRYTAVNAMLLNEFLKEHKTVQEQSAAIARQQKEIEALTAAVQKVSAQLELSIHQPKTVQNNH